MFEDITVGLFWLATTWFVANIVLGVLDGLRAANIELRAKLTKQLDEVIHRVRAEQHDDVIYWYDRDDGEFLAQGRSQEELIAVVRSRYPDHLFFLESNHILGRGSWDLATARRVEIVNQP